jgi:hypothetical protein
MKTISEVERVVLNALSKIGSTSPNQRLGDRPLHLGETQDQNLNRIPRRYVQASSLSLRKSVNVASAKPATFGVNQ